MNAATIVAVAAVAAAVVLMAAAVAVVWHKEARRPRLKDLLDLSRTDHDRVQPPPAPADKDTEEPQ